MTTLPTGGLVAVAVTPLDERGAVDIAGIGRLMDFYVNCGASGVALLGVMGEANRMT
nr:dihydrodipicolinate synthase family protein [Desulfuromonadales bacterium]